MHTKQKILDTIRNHKKEIEKFGVRRLSLFGSIAREEGTETSDVDMLVELKQPIGWEIVDLRDYLQELLGAKVDLVTRPAVVKKSILWKSIQEDLIHV